MREKLYRLNIDRTLTAEEQTALWKAFVAGKFMRGDTFEELPDSLKAMSDEVKVK